jgi:hypothetical protein
MMLLIGNLRLFALGIAGRRKHHWQIKINHRLTIPNGAPARDARSIQRRIFRQMLSQKC